MTGAEVLAIVAVGGWRPLPGGGHVHETARIDPGASIGVGAAIGVGASIGHGACIGGRASIEVKKKKEGNHA